MKHVNYTLYSNTNRVIPIETTFYKHNQENFWYLFQMEDFSTMQGVVLVSQGLVLLEEEIFLCLPLRRAEWGFLLNLHLQVVKRFWSKSIINSRSKNSVYIQLINFPVKSNIVHVRRHLIPACVHILCTYTWKYFVSQFRCSLLVGGNWNSR